MIVYGLFQQHSYHSQPTLPCNLPMPGLAWVWHPTLWTMSVLVFPETAIWLVVTLYTGIPPYLQNFDTFNFLIYYSKPGSWEKLNFKFITRKKLEILCNWVFEDKFSDVIYKQNYFIYICHILHHQHKHCKKNIFLWYFLSSMP